MFRTGSHLLGLCLLLYVFLEEVYTLAIRELILELGTKLCLGVVWYSGPRNLGWGGMVVGLVWYGGPRLVCFVMVDLGWCGIVVW